MVETSSDQLTQHGYENMIGVPCTFYRQVTHCAFATLWADSLVHWGIGTIDVSAHTYHFFYLVLLIANYQCFIGSPGIVHSNRQLHVVHHIY